MEIFKFNTYKEFLVSYISKNDRRGLMTEMALQMGCDRTYLSQVLSGKAQLTPDHLIDFCEANQFAQKQADFLLLLLLKDRASSRMTAQALLKRIKILKENELRLTKKISSEAVLAELEAEKRTLYYSTWIYSAVHILTSIKDLQTVDALALHLSTTPSRVRIILKDLEAMKLIERQKDRFIHRGGDIYLKEGSPQLLNHHLNWRLRATERSFEQEDIHYTVTFSVSEKDIDTLRAQIVGLIEKQRSQTKSSGSEVACAFTCDFFRI